MTVKVTATCEWCLITKQTTIDKPVPEGWKSGPIADIETLGAGTQPGNFCTDTCQKAYDKAGPIAFEEARVDFVAKFYASMNKLREKK